MLVEEGGVAWDSKGKGKTCLQITQNSKTKAWLREWGKKQQKGTELWSCDSEVLKWHLQLIALKANIWQHLQYAGVIVRILRALCKLAFPQKRYSMVNHHTKPNTRFLKLQAYNIINGNNVRWEVSLRQKHSKANFIDESERSHNEKYLTWQESTNRG